MSPAWSTRTCAQSKKKPLKHGPNLAVGRLGIGYGHAIRNLHGKHLQYFAFQT